VKQNPLMQVEVMRAFYVYGSEKLPAGKKPVVKMK
jgi:hypothetical protein